MILRPISKNRKGDFESTLYIVIILFIIGFIFIFVNRLTHQLSMSMEAVLNSTTATQNSSAITAIQTIRATDDTAWDYGFLAIYIGALMSLAITAFSTRVHAVFYIIYAVMGLFILLVGVMLSNTWQTMAENPELVSTVARYPITNFMLGTYAPLMVTGAIVLVMVLLFGKTPDQASGQGGFG